MFFDSITKTGPIIKPHCYKKIQKYVFFWYNVCDFLNLSIFVREYRTKRPGASHSKERHVTKPQISHNNMQKTRPRYLNLEIFLLRISFDTKKNTLYKLNAFQFRILSLFMCFHFIWGSNDIWEAVSI